MEKLICPECGQSVLPDDKVCTNCGCEITVCPDCGAVCRDGAARCLSCGRVLSEEVLHVQIKEDAKKMEKRLDADEKREKTIKKIQLVCPILFLLLMGLGVFLYFSWAKQNAAEQLLNMRSRMNLCKALFGIGIIFAALNLSLIVVKDTMGIPSLCRWLGDTKCDYRAYIRIHANAGKEFVGAVLYSDKLAQAALCYENKKEKALLNFYVAVHFILGIASVISAIIYSCEMISQQFVSWIEFSIDLSVVDLQWIIPAFYPTVIIAGVFAIWSIICPLIFSIKAKRKKQEILSSKN